MAPTKKALFELTAGDLMSHEVITIPAELPLADAARQLRDANVHGAPVVDRKGRCVGVLSVSDLARWALNKSGPGVGPARACTFQERQREPGGKEVVLCTLPPGACLFQRPRRGPDGRAQSVCTQPQALCVDWQMMEFGPLPAEDARHYMTTGPVVASMDEPVRSLARYMIEAAVHRVIVVDEHGRPVGVVSTTDVLDALANADH